MSQPTGRTLVHVADPERWDGSVDGVDLLPSTATAAALSDALDEAEETYARARADRSGSDPDPSA